jgi:hypothetical protein
MNLSVVQHSTPSPDPSAASPTQIVFSSMMVCRELTRNSHRRQE